MEVDIEPKSALQSLIDGLSAVSRSDAEEDFYEGGYSRKGVNGTESSEKEESDEHESAEEDDDGYDEDDDAEEDAAEENSDEDEDNNEYHTEEEDSSADESWRDIQFEEVPEVHQYMCTVRRGIDAGEAEIIGFVEYFAVEVWEYLETIRHPLDPPAPEEHYHVDASTIHFMHNDAYNPSISTAAARSRGTRTARRLFRRAMQYGLASHIILTMIEFLEGKEDEVKMSRRDFTRLYNDGRIEEAQAKDFHFYRAVRIGLEGLYVQQSEMVAMEVVGVAG